MTCRRRTVQGNAAEHQAINFFATNLGQLLLAPPARVKTILWIDPGFRTGSKAVVIDPSELDTLFVKDPTDVITVGESCGSG